MRSANVANRCAQTHCSIRTDLKIDSVIIVDRFKVSAKRSRKQSAFDNWWRCFAVAAAFSKRTVCGASHAQRTHWQAQRIYVCYGSYARTTMRSVHNESEDRYWLLLNVFCTFNARLSEARLSCRLQRLNCAENACRLSKNCSIAVSVIRINIL